MRNVASNTAGKTANWLSSSLSKAVLKNGIHRRTCPVETFAENTALESKFIKFGSYFFALQVPFNQLLRAYVVRIVLFYFK
jgi:hypothetical protein